MYSPLLIEDVGCSNRPWKHDAWDIRLASKAETQTLGMSSFLKHFTELHTQLEFEPKLGFPLQSA